MRDVRTRKILRAGSIAPACAQDVGDCSRGPVYFQADSALALNFGGRFALNEQGTLLVSLGHELYNDFEGRAALFGYVGWQMMR